MGVNELKGAISAPLGDYFLGNILKIFLEKVFKKVFKNLKKILCIILLNLCSKIAKKNHFQSFPNPFISLFTT
jgi:hypothetical protein